MSPLLGVGASRRCRAPDGGGGGGVEVFPGTGEVTVTAFAPTVTTSSASGILFEADWSTEIGATENACTDGGAFNVTTNLDTDYLDVVSASGLDFPVGMSNVLRVRRNGTGHSTDVRAQGLWSVPSVGQKLFYRIYLRNDISNAVGDQAVSNHAVQFVDGVPAFEFNIWVDSWANGNFKHRWNNGNSDNSKRFRPGTDNPQVAATAKFATWRLEWMLERTGTSTWFFDYRTYNSAGTLVYDRSNYYNNNGSQTLDAYLDGGGTMSVTAANTDKIQIGSSGGEWSFSSDQYYYFGGFMVRSDDWCGAY